MTLTPNTLTRLIKALPRSALYGLRGRHPLPMALLELAVELDEARGQVLEPHRTRTSLCHVRGHAAQKALGFRRVPLGVVVESPGVTIGDVCGCAENAPAAEAKSPSGTLKVPAMAARCAAPDASLT